MANQSLEAEVIRVLRSINRLQTQARKLRRQLKTNKISLRFERKKLRAIQLDIEDRHPDAAPMRLVNGAAGILPHRPKGLTPNAAKAPTEPNTDNEDLDL